MIRMSVFYANDEGATFDHDYYRDTHVPLCLSTWNLSEASIDRGVDGPFIAAVHFEFDTMEDMQAALAAEGTAAVQADVANYTSLTPTIQVSEIVG